MRVCAYCSAIYQSVIMVDNSVIYLWIWWCISYKFVSVDKINIITRDDKI